MTHKSIYWYFRLLVISHLVIVGVFYLVMGSYVAAGNLSKTHLVDLSGRPFGSDFLPYWAASRLAMTRDPAAIYSRDEIYSIQKGVIGAEIPHMIWPYPPTFLLLVLPLAFLPYAVSFICWLAVTGTGFLYVIRRLIPNNPLFWLVLVFPGTVNNVLFGQNGFLSAAFLGGGLILAERHPFAGGCLLGLLSYKPQLAWLIPLALAAGRYWRALLGAVISAVALALASLCLLGSDVWIAFFKNLPIAANSMNHPHLWGKMPTVFAAARLLGSSWELAGVLQVIAIIGVILALGWVWFWRYPLPIRGSVLAVGILLATPHAFDYDLTILALPFAWLGWEAYTHEAEFQELTLLFAWCLLAWATLGPPWVLSWAPNFPFRLAVLAALLLLAVYRAARPLLDSSA